MFSTAKEAVRKLCNNKFFRFLIAGGINTLFSYCCFAILMFLFQNKELAVTLNLLIAVFFNYNMSARFVFQEREMSVRQIIKFYLVYLATYPLNLLHLHVTVDIWNWNVYISQLVTLLYMPLINFTLQKLLIFRNKSEQEGN